MKTIGMFLATRGLVSSKQLEKMITRYLFHLGLYQKILCVTEIDLEGQLPYNNFCNVGEVIYYHEEQCYNSKQQLMYALADIILRGSYVQKEYFGYELTVFNKKRNQFCSCRQVWDFMRSKLDDSCFEDIAVNNNDCYYYSMFLDKFKEIMNKEDEE